MKRLFRSFAPVVIFFVLGLMHFLYTGTRWRSVVSLSRQAENSSVQSVGKMYFPNGTELEVGEDFRRRLVRDIDSAAWYVVNHEPFDDVCRVQIGEPFGIRIVILKSQKDGRIMAEVYEDRFWYPFRLRRTSSEELRALIDDSIPRAP